MVSTRSKTKSVSPKTRNPKVGNGKIGETSGINKPNTNARKSNARSKKDLQDRKIKQKSEKDELQKKLETINQQLQETEIGLTAKEITDEIKTEMEGRLKRLMGDKKQSESRLSEFEGALKKTEEDLMEIDQDGESTSLNAQTSSSDASSSKVADGLQDASSNGQMSTTTSPSKETTDPQDSSKNTFSSQKENLDEEYSSSGMDMDGEFLSETASEPSDYGDFDVIDLTKDENDSHLLEGGKTLVTAKRRGGKLYLNSYGPKNSAMLTWSSSPAAKEGRNVTNILADPHRKAVERDDDGNLKYKGKIDCIKAIAWEPKCVIRCMQDLLDSVEELNPMRKEGKKYRFPFSSVLVGWKEGQNMPPSAWVSRTNYKSLTSTSKEESGRTDRKFYTIARIQAKRYREWAGDARMGRDDNSPTPLRETAEPENHLNSQNVHQNPNDQNPNNQNPSNQNPSNQNPSNQNPSNQNTSNQNHNDEINGQSTNSENTAPNDESPNGGVRASSTLENKRNQVPNTFNQKEYIQGMIELLDLDAIRKNNLAEYIKQLALVKAEWDSYKKLMIEKGMIEEK